MREEACTLWFCERKQMQKKRDADWTEILSVFMQQVPKRRHQEVCAVETLNSISSMRTVLRMRSHI